jgi:hypothetical protein
MKAVGAVVVLLLVVVGLLAARGSLIGRESRTEPLPPAASAGNAATSLSVTSGPEDAAPTSSSNATGSQAADEAVGEGGEEGLITQEELEAALRELEARLTQPEPDPVEQLRRIRQIIRKHREDFDEELGKGDFDTAQKVINALETIGRRLDIREQLQPAISQMRRDLREALPPGTRPPASRLQRQPVETQ